MISNQKLVAYAGQEYFDLIVSRLKAKGLESAEVCALETLKFLVISTCAGSSFLHGDGRIDSAWHEFILETKRYRSLCEAIRPGSFLDHTGIEYSDYEHQVIPQQLHAEELSFIANYVDNFGDFTESTVAYWTTCHDICKRMGWTIAELNQLAREYHQKAMEAEEIAMSQTPSVVSRLGSKLARGGELSPEELVEYMQNYGRRIHGSSAFHFSRFRNERGQDPYQWMILSAPDRECSKVLDVGCGVGHGLSLFPTSYALAGIDVSPDEVERARVALRGRLAQIEVAASQSIPFADSMFDVVVCHMTLMLFNPIEPALQEVARVMKANGTFSAVIPASWSDIQPHTAEFNALVMGSAKAAYPSYPYIGIGNGKLKSKDSIRALVKETMGAECNVTIDDDIFHLRTSIADAVLFASQLYWFDLLPAKHKKEAERAFLTHFESLLDHEGKTLLSRPFARLTVQKK
jgi:SAM-dependent methyltransferase